MLKLTISPSENPIVKTFQQDVITIGSDDGLHSSDVILSDRELQPIHIKIVRNDQRYQVINHTNDPFATLNDLPFGKKTLRNKDLLQIGSHTILLEVEENLKVPKPHPIIEKQVIEEQKELVPSPTTTPYLHKSPAPEYEVGEFDDESENWAEKETSPSDDEKGLLSYINWKLFGIIASSLFFIFCLTATAFYFNINAKNEEEEMKAAEAISNIAMALKYAQIHHIKPHKKNWSDPEFIKTNLSQVIPLDYPSLAKIDQQGHLNQTSYSLRVYTSTDFSQFLVIAQPAPSILQWLIPKTAIVIDSKIMQLRKVIDMKTLNRLLVNSNNLDNSNAIEVTNLVKQGELIPLSTLTKKYYGQDFAVPKALALLRPGAENYIYNAPRYYQFGETIIKDAISLMEAPGSVYELARLKQEMSLLSKMSDMVLYSSNGIQLTMKAQKAIATFVSNNSFLTAYLKFNPEGQILSSHLIIDDEESHYATEQKVIAPETTTFVKDQDTIAEAAVKTIEPASQDEKKEVQEEEYPLIKKLNQLRQSRENALTPLKNHMSALLEEHNKKPIEGLELRFADLIESYHEQDHQLKHEIATAIHQLAEEYQLLPLNEFIEWIDKAGLSSLSTSSSDNEEQEKQLESYLKHMKIAENFIELKQILSETVQWLVVRNFKDFRLLYNYKKIVQNRAIDRVNELLFSSKPTPLSLEFNEDQNAALQQLLKMCCLECEEDEQYYLNEFTKINFNN